MSSSSSSPDRYCYCPAALAELRQARAACADAANLLRQRDPEYDAREALKAATRELNEARDLLQRVLGATELLEQLRETPRLYHQAQHALEAAEGIRDIAKLARIDEALASVDRIERLMDRLENTEIRVIYADA